MEFQSNYIGTQIEYNCFDIKKHLASKAPQETPAASLDDQLAGNNFKQFNENALFAEPAVDFCLTNSLANESTSEPQITAGIQCWKLAKNDLVLQDKIATTSPQYSIPYIAEHIASSDMGPPLTQENHFPNYEKPIDLGLFNMGGTCAAEIDQISAPGFYLSTTHQQHPFEYLKQMTASLPADTFKGQILSSNTERRCSDSHKAVVSHKGPIPWELRVSDIPVSDSLISSTKLDDTTTLSPHLEKLQNDHILPYVPAQNRAAARFALNWQEMGFLVREYSGYDTPNTSCDDKYEPAALSQYQEVIYSTVHQMAPVEGDLSRKFVFGTTGEIHNSLDTLSAADKSALSTLEEPDIYSMHILPSDGTDFWTRYLNHDTQDERHDITWTKSGSIPTGPSYSLAGQAHLHRLDQPQQDSLNLAYDMLSRIQVYSPPSSARADNVPPKMDELIISFEANPGAGKSKLKRKSFSVEGRQKVKLVRKNGACFPCRVRKIECSADGACNNCLKAVHDVSLATQVCFRNKFKDSYIGVKDIHHSLCARKDQLQNIISSLTGTAKQVLLWVEGSSENSQHIAKLQLEVMQCHSSTHCRWKTLQKINGIYITAGSTCHKRYVIIPSALPSVDQLDLFGRQILSFSAGAHSGAIISWLDSCLLLYCRQNRHSRIRHLANATLRIASLNCLVAYGLINLHDGSYDLLSHWPSQNQRYVSETIHDQTRLRAAEGLKTAEEYLFSELDNLREILGSNGHNRIITGICLLRLAILYRERMIRDEIRLGLPRHGNRHQTRLEKAAFMYKRLTVVYATLCRATDSPLTMHWQSETGINIVEEDEQILRTTLLKLQAAYKEFCNDKLTQKHDELFKTLIVEPASMANRKSRKRRS